MKVSRMAVFLIGSFALLLAISLPGIIKTLLIAYTVFTGGLLLPTVAGFYKEQLKLTSGGALCALVGGGITALFLGQSFPLLGMAVSGVLLLAVSYMERRHGKEKRGHTMLCQRPP
jgi:SSS family solute:Na+ symporter